MLTLLHNDNEIPKSPVFSTGMAFVIPLRRIRESIRGTILNEYNSNSDIIQDSNAKVKYVAIDRTLSHLISTTVPMKGYYLSKPTGNGKVELRDVRISFYIFQYEFVRICQPEWALIILVDSDIMAKENTGKIEDFITPHDIVYLKMAMFGKNAGNHIFLTEDADSNTLDAVITQLVKDITPQGYTNFNNVAIKGAVVSVKVWLIDQNSPTDNFDKLKQYLHKRDLDSDSHKLSIQSFLKYNISGYIRSDDTKCTDLERWIYGLLFSNINYMMAEDSAVIKSVKPYYSNNFVERYWVVPLSIVKVSTGYPFIGGDSASRDASRDFEIDSLLEMLLIIVLNNRIKTLLSEHGSMKYYEVENRKAEIESCFNYTITNLVELDTKLKHFFKHSNVSEGYENALRIIAPRRTVIEKYHAGIIALLGIVIAFLTLIVTSI